MVNDQLTGLRSRPQLMRDLAHQMEASQVFSYIVINVNRFRYINENLGYDVGDRLLQMLAQKLEKIALNRNYRISADEFVCLVAPSDVSYVANQLSHMFAEPVMIDTHRFFVSVSIGIAHYPAHAQTINDLMRYATYALNEAKQHRGNTIKQFDRTTITNHINYLQMETILKRALAEHLFILYYQPKFCLKTNRITGVETLIRLYDEGLGFVPPDVFIPFAEESNLIIDIGQWVLEEATRQVKVWRDAFDTTITVAINMPSKQLIQPDFLTVFEQALEKSGASPDAIEIEITERMLIDENADVLMKLEHLQHIGVKIAIDDFGTGYSCLSYLQHLPVDVLKIDRCFTEALKPGRQTIVSSTIELGHSLQLHVVAEGIETLEQLNLLKSLGCDVGQGYYLSRPQPAEEIAMLLTQVTMNDV